jgi:hypothetical protein
VAASSNFNSTTKRLFYDRHGPVPQASGRIPFGGSRCAVNLLFRHGEGNL